MVEPKRPNQPSELANLKGLPTTSKADVRKVVGFRNVRQYFYLSEGAGLIELIWFNWLHANIFVCILRRAACLRVRNFTKEGGQTRRCLLFNEGRQKQIANKQRTDDGRWSTDDDEPRTTDAGRRTPDDGRRTTDDGRRTADDGRMTDGRRTDDGRRMTNGRRTTDDGRTIYIYIYLYERTDLLGYYLLNNWRS